MGKQNGRAETWIKFIGDASKVPGSAAPALTKCRGTVVLPPPQGHGERGPAEDRLQKTGAEGLCFQAVVMTVVQV